MNQVKQALLNKSSRLSYGRVLLRGRLYVASSLRMIAAGGGQVVSIRSERPLNHAASDSGTPLSIGFGVVAVRLKDFFGRDDQQHFYSHLVKRNIFYI
ncbi:MAG: hypothetical protein ACYCYL_00190 [Acidithiobacillus sp.]